MALAIIDPKQTGTRVYPDSAIGVEPGGAQIQIENIKDILDGKAPMPTNFLTVISYFPVLNQQRLHIFRVEFKGVLGREIPIAFPELPQAGMVTSYPRWATLQIWEQLA